MTPITFSQSSRPRPHRIVAFILMVAGAVSSWYSDNALAAEQRRPNLVFILADDRY